MTDNATNSSNLKGAFTIVLMLPVLVAIAVGAYFTAANPSDGLPMLLGGVVLGVFNFFVLRYLFARMKTMEEEDASTPRSSGKTSS